MFATIAKNQIRNDETYITLYGVFTYDENEKTFDPSKHSRDPKTGKFIKGKCKDITKGWMKHIQKGSIYKAKEIKVDEKTYKLTDDGYEDKNIRITFKPQDEKTEKREEFVRNAIHSATGAKIVIYPRIELMDGKRTPDIQMGINNNKYEIKTLEKKESECKDGENPLFKQAREAKEQANNFVFNVSSDIASIETSRKWLKEIYKKPDTKFVKKAILLFDGKIDKVLVREESNKKSS